MSGQRLRHRRDGAAGELSHRRRTGDGPQLLLRLLGHHRHARSLAGGARGSGHRRTDFHCDRRHRTARACHQRAARVVEACDRRRHRPADRRDRVAVGRRDRRLSRHAGDARHAADPADPGRAGEPGADRDPDGAQGAGRVPHRHPLVCRCVGPTRPGQV